MQTETLMPPVSAGAFNLEFSKLQLCLPRNSGWQTLFLYGFLHTTFWKQGNKFASWSTVTVTDSQDTQSVYSFQSTPGLGRGTTLYQWIVAHINDQLHLKMQVHWWCYVPPIILLEFTLEIGTVFGTQYTFSKCLLNPNTGYREVQGESLKYDHDIFFGFDLHKKIAAC